MNKNRLEKYSEAFSNAASVEPKPKYNISLHVKMPQNTFTMKKRSSGYASVRLCYEFDEICAIMSLFGV